ncbi:MAG: tRNA dihydrouridine(20/20a) synthase DusA [Phaeovulum sp.]|uniref:tRNA dihydrouridine(20/20a) synthase DusA n=1 Tax=Phaeovulum sp. TaxID=2934796 RepID=UPI0027352D41|nr:tRNA dihydrouridine(20/20a) synthase DusA [Phaeovulum sp.]MDP3861363.1 tRNA dihydrouridine(20/20a) synthase DusA [Phaeovulum sp.]
MSPVRAAARLAVAPMMDWTDRHCRRFHREISRGALLYTEMVTAPALIHGDRARLLDYDPAEHPVALQLGGSDPAELREATRIAAGWGYDEINLNCGCPSDRVQAGTFGAVLMKTPALVADCVAAMAEVAGVEVTVKCRIGVDEQTPSEALPAILETVAAAGVSRFIIHARKAWLQGLSPRENREVPPLDYPLVLAMKRAYPHLHISLNGGVACLAEAEALLAQGLDGVMVGRAAYHEPWNILGTTDARLFGLPGPRDAFAVAEAMRPYIAAHLARGGRLHQVSRHMLGLFHGRPGARGWRRALSEGASAEGAGLALYDAALAEVARA